ncbi:MAG: phosphoribosylamine--glycine ligase [Selenomonadaceae bacterium]|nr:phosphoribosylamine--glycine ligase [Selenomonadaceae bacterium]
MNVLLIGSGGREHALAWKISKSPLLKNFYAIPGNPGISKFAECIENISVENNSEVVKFAQEKNIDLVVVGPEAPLVNGLVDDLEKANIKSFGCNKKAAQLEGSKIFAKNLMKKYEIPTAAFEVFDNPDDAKKYITSQNFPIVIKADGLAAGKGVIIAENLEDALNAVDEMKNFGDAGNKIVVEEFMNGEEASVLAFTDGKIILPMIPAQDHKRVFDNDEGLNTGGMGAYAPAPVVNSEVMKKVEEKILRPIISALNSEGIIYRGCLYAGLMITNGEPKVVEFNARFGDPETQVVLPLLESDLLEIMLACAEGNLSEKKILWSNDSAVCVVLASGGYPKSYKKNFEIIGIDEAEKFGAEVFHAGTKKSDEKILTAGGRVLGVTVTEKNIPAAIEKVYKCVEKIHFDEMHFRKDIATKALKFTSEEK